MNFVLGVLGLLDQTIYAMLGIPIFVLFLAGFLMVSVMGLAMLLKDAVYGRSRR